MANWMSASSIHLAELSMRTCASRSGTCLMQTMIFMLKRLQGVFPRLESKTTADPSTPVVAATSAQDGSAAVVTLYYPARAGIEPSVVQYPGVAVRLRWLRRGHRGTSCCRMGKLCQWWRRRWRLVLSRGRGLRDRRFLRRERRV